MVRSVTRLGGDEFIVLLSGGITEAADTAERLITAVQTPFHYQNLPVSVGASTGITSFPEHGQDPSSVMSAADLALYRAKGRGKGQYVLFMQAFREEELNRRRFERELETAVREHQFVLHYQPRYSSTGASIIGCEALVRWQHPVRGLLLPAQFIDLLIKIPLSVTLGEWIIRNALRQVRQWQLHLPSLRVSINLFPRQISTTGLEEILYDSAGGFADYVDFEIDESLLTTLIQETPERFEAVRMTGASFIIDHYGRAVGAISLLRQGFLSGLKIDKTLTLQLHTSMRVRMMFRGIAALGKSLGINVSAEGVEDNAQRKFVTLAGCDIIQGSGLCLPLSAQAFEALICGTESTDVDGISPC